jgi:hypothetical protein
MQYYQQGDVLIKRIQNLPEGLQLLTTKVLQESETTGHHHHFLPNAPVQVYQNPTFTEEKGVTTITTNQGKYIVVLEDTHLYHGKEFEHAPFLKGQGDHASLLLLKGTYEIDIVREQDFFSEEVHRVVD